MQFGNIGQAVRSHAIIWVLLLIIRQNGDGCGYTGCSGNLAFFH